VAHSDPPVRFSVRNRRGHHQGQSTHRASPAPRRDHAEVGHAHQDPVAAGSDGRRQSEADHPGAAGSDGLRRSSEGAVPSEQSRAQPLARLLARPAEQDEERPAGQSPGVGWVPVAAPGWDAALGASPDAAGAFEHGPVRSTHSPVENERHGVLQAQPAAHPGRRQALPAAPRRPALPERQPRRAPGTLLESLGDQPARMPGSPVVLGSRRQEVRARALAPSPRPSWRRSSPGRQALRAGQAGSGRHAPPSGERGRPVLPRQTRSGSSRRCRARYRDRAPLCS
jgi:hypothetical protein